VVASEPTEVGGVRSEDEIRRRLVELENAALRPLTTFGPVPRVKEWGDQADAKEKAWRRFVRRAETERDMLRWVLNA
jgi:hypothetical protein